MDSAQTSMQAVVFNGPLDMTVQTLPRPSPAPGEVLLRIETVGICSSDVHGFTGESGRRAPGMVMGHEASGQVVAHGPDVRGPAIGSRVVVFNILAHVAPAPGEGDPSFLNKQVIGVNLGRRGAMAEYLALPAKNALTIDEGVAPEIGLLAEPLAVVTHGFHRLQRTGVTGKKLAIVGCGPIGLATILVAGARGFDNIAVLDTNANRAERGRSFGARPVVVDSEESKDAVATRVEAALSGPADVVVEAVGSQSSALTCFALANTGSTILLIGNIAKQVELPLQDVVSKEVTLVGTYGFDDSSFGESLAMLPQVQDRLATFIEDRCTLEETPEMMAALANGGKRPLKVIIDIWRG